MIDKVIDTIVAISTPKGQGAIGIIRISGFKAKNIAEIITKKKIKPWIIQKTSFFSNDVLIDVGLVLFFEKPKSFTGEDVIEFHSHGSVLILNTLLFKVLELGARLAEPGEFSFRAYFNGKLDLLQAESINSLIQSNSLNDNNSILKSLTGLFSKKLKYINNNILLLRRDVEAFINFPDSIFFHEDHFINNFFCIKNEFFDFYNKIYFGNLNKNFFKVSIIGNTNVGKSSLFNFLLRNKRSIVSDIHGTTRDFIEEPYKINDNISLNLVDTAGFNLYFKTILEKSSLLKTFEQINKSYLIIYVFDVNQCFNAYDDKIFNMILKYFNKKKFLVVYNKIDLLNLSNKFKRNTDFIEFYISVKENLGLNELIKEINLNFSQSVNNLFFVDEKFLDSFFKIKNMFLECEKILISDYGFDFFSEELKKIYDEISNILGKNIESDVIKKIFSNFCLGK